MKKKLVSEKFKLPPVYFITDRSERRDIPISIPCIFGREEDEPYIIRLLEYEVLWERAIKTGYSFNFKLLLKEAGFDITDYGISPTCYFDYNTEENLEEEWEENEDLIISNDNDIFKKFIRDASAYVDLAKLKELKVMPVWYDSIEKAVDVNIHNFAIFNPLMYNKKLDGIFGALEFQSPKKNLIICDISSSIPKAVSTTTLLMSRNLGESFYCDIMVTGRITIIIPYEEIYNFDVEEIYAKVGMSNEQKDFKRLVSLEERNYGTCIAFGDNNHPGDIWSSRSDKRISDEDGKKLCKWNIDKLISFHTEGTEHLAGYSRWFKPKEVERISDWVKYLD